MTLQTTQPRKAYYFYRIHLGQDNYITEFCVYNHGDPDQYMETPAPDGSMQRWDKQEEGNLLVFKAPDGYVGGAVGWCYDKSLQTGEHAPYDVIDREQLRNRKSLIVNGLKS